MTYHNTRKQNNMTPFDIHNDHEDLSETEFLKNSIANHTKYGSTNCNFSSQNFRFITHYIEQTDTLQGLALKYGCKIENIKKFNKLYSDDNNHLRSRFSIVIPIEIKTRIQFESDISSSQSSQSSLDPGNNRNDITNYIPNECQQNNRHRNATKSSNNQQYKKTEALERNAHSFDNFTSDKNKSNKNSPNNFTNLKSVSLTETTTNHLNDQQDVQVESAADFLIRIDSSIAKTKNQVESFTKRVASSSIETELNRTKKFQPPKLASDREIFGSSAASTSRSIFDQDLPNVNITRNNKKIKSSLKRLEKSQEEIFEL